MRSRLLTLCLSLFLAACTATLPSTVVPRELSGVISEDLTLSGNVLLTGDLLILPGRTLTLLPGTTLRIRTSESTKIDPEYLSSYSEILVRGTLNAVGTAADPISFLPETPVVGDEIAWAGIIFDRTAGGAISQTRIEGAEQVILVISSSLQLSENTIRHCRYGIVVQGQGSAAIHNNQIADGEGGLFVLAGATPDIVGNHISAQVEEGLFVDAESSPHIGRNEITGNAIGLLLHNSTLPFERSGISGNREDLRMIEEGE